MLLEGTSGTARVLEALAGGWPQPVVATAACGNEDDGGVGAEVQGELFEPSGRLASDPCDTSILGPRLELSLEAGLAGSGSRLWDAIEERCEPVPSAAGSDGAAETGHPEDLNAWLGIAEPSLPEELALACEVGARIDETPAALTTPLPTIGAWSSLLSDPTDLLARDVLWARALGSEGDTAKTAEPPAQRSAKSADEDVEQAEEIERASEQSVATRPRIAAERVAIRGSSGASKPATTAARLAGRLASVTRAGPRFRWPKLRWPWRYGRLDGEALRRKRQEVFRKALARFREEPEGSTTFSEHGSETMSGTNKLEWRPGDPFAGARRRRFRWHAMFLAAGGVAGTGYAALWLLKTAGMLSA